MKKVFVLFIILSQLIYSQWEIDYSDYDEDGLISISTINTNEGAAWLEIWTYSGGAMLVIMHFGGRLYFNENVKVEYKLDKESSKIITADGYSDGCGLFSSGRNHDSVVAFIDELETSKTLTITLYDSSNDKHTYEFDISNLEEALVEAHDYF